VCPSWNRELQHFYCPGLSYTAANLVFNVLSIHRPHVELLTDHIQKITKIGIVIKNNRSIKVDRIIYATGFETTFKPKYPFQGRGGKDLGEVWAKRPKGMSQEGALPV
jgi:cation diffusion facilitator CzcD-associated flavoprotein CzcO